MTNPTMTDTKSVVSPADGGTGLLARLFDEERGGISFRHFCYITFQLGAVLLAIWQFKIEASYGLLQLVPLLFVGFLVHSLIPLEFRMPGFLILSLSAILMVLGLSHGLMVIGGGLVFIAVCHLPIRLAYRLTIIIALAAFCAALRGGWVATPMDSVTTLVIPVLAAMFMFRLAVYLYDITNGEKPNSVWETLSYFSCCRTCASCFSR